MNEELPSVPPPAPDHVAALPIPPAPPTPPPPAYAMQSHPPVMPGALQPRRTAWPTVIGVIAIVFGVLGFLQGCLSMGMLLLVPSLQNFKMPNGVDPFAGTAQWQGWLVAIGVVTTVIAGVLLAGGIALNGRRASSRGLILTWAVSKMLLAVGSSFVSYHVQQAQIAAMQQSNVNMPGMQSFMSLFGVIGVFISIIWLWALPVFMIIWFMRGSIREEVRWWSAANANNRATQSPGMAMPGL